MEKYYEILGLKMGALKSDIKAAYKKLAKMYHPDKNPGNAACEEKMKEINTAYDAVMNPSSVKHKFGDGTTDSSGFGDTEFNRGYRRTSDSKSGGFGGGFGGADFKKMYDELFRDRQKKYKQGFEMRDETDGGRNDNDITRDFTHTLQEILNGVELKSEIDREIICTSCDGKRKICSVCGGQYARVKECIACAGTGVEQCKDCGGKGYVTLKKEIKVVLNIRKMSVKITRGDNGKSYIVLRFTGMGNQGTDYANVHGVKFGGNVITGDLYYRVLISDNRKDISFASDGDIIQNISVDLVDMLRGEVEFISAEGKEYKFDTRRLNTSGTADIEIPGAGFMKNSNGDMGSYVFRVTPVMPDFMEISEEDKKTIINILEKIYAS